MFNSALDAECDTLKDELSSLVEMKKKLTKSLELLEQEERDLKEEVPFQDKIKFISSQAPFFCSDSAKH